MEEDESSHTELLEEDIPATIPLEDPNEDSGDGTTLTLNPNLALVERLHAQVRQNARDLLQRKIQMRRELTDGDRLALEHCRLFPNPESINVTGNAAFDSTRFLVELDVRQVKSITITGTTITNLEGIGVDPMPQLTSLWLQHNRINDITGFLQGKFDKLSEVSLCGNHISNIDMLSGIGPHLRQLYLNDNRITSIASLPQFDLRNLKLLELSQNNMSDISCLRRVDLKSLRSLHLNHNQISDCDFLPRVNLQNLKSLFLSNNHLGDIGFIAAMPVSKLKLLDLSFNHITDIRVLLKNRIFVNVYLLEVEDFFPGCYLPGNPISEQYYDAIRDAVGPAELKYIQTEENMDWDEIGMKYPREGQSEFEQQGQEHQGGEEGEGRESGQGGQEGEQEGGEGEGGGEGGEQEQNNDGQQQPEEERMESEENPPRVRRSERIRTRRTNR